jgi:poly(3-hydroxybutyrate) depolymerase
LLYVFYELNHAAVAPVRAMAQLMGAGFRNPLNPISRTAFGKQMAAGASLFERATRRYGKPDFGIETVPVDGRATPVREEVVSRRSFCDLLHFRRDLPEGRKPDPKLLIVAPMSGHYASLLRGTVETMAENHDVYITDWIDARMVPVTEGEFGLDDYIDYVIEMLREIGPGASVMAVCQPSVPVMAAVALMEADDDPASPVSMTLMGGPIDTRINPTAVNRLAEERGTDWFRSNVVVRVPFPHPGAMRAVYPGFLQLTGFMSMNLDRHLTAHKEFYWHLVEGDGDSADKHEEFYDEYLAVMDLDALFYLETVERVFVQHALPKGEFRYRGRKVDPSAIRKVGLLTVEGERDDISGVGQTEAAHLICHRLPLEYRAHYLQPGVGHYGVFNGRRFKAEIAPRISAFIREIGARRGGKAGALAAADAVNPTLPPRFAANGAAHPPAPVAPRAEDDLKLIRGIGPGIEKKLKGFGIASFADIAGWTPETVAEFDRRLAIKGRIERDDWVGQARALTRH